MKEQFSNGERCAECEIEFEYSHGYPVLCTVCANYYQETGCRMFPVAHHRVKVENVKY